MIIFDLPCLADDSHRRHLIDAEYRARCGYCFSCEDGSFLCKDCQEFYKDWQPNYPAYYDACDQDTPILSTIQIFKDIKRGRRGETIPTKFVIWSGRC